MIILRSRFLQALVMVCLLGSGGASVSHAQTQAESAKEKAVHDPTGGLPTDFSAEREELRVIKLRPRLAEGNAKSRLFPGRSDLQPGDAAPIFLRQNFEASSAIPKRREFLASDPLEIKLDNAKILEVKSLGLYRVNELERAALREHAGWEYPLYEPQYEGGGIRTLLPDVQESRAVISYLCQMARAAIAQGNSSEAERYLRIAMGLTRHISETPFIVVKLVAAAQLRAELFVLEELVQLPSAPNYYWDLASIPRPMIETRDAVQWEWNIIAQTFPQLLHLDRLKTSEQWQELQEAIIGGLLDRNDGSIPAAGTPEFEKFKQNWIAKARKVLPTTESMTAERVSQMSDPEAAVRYWWSRVQQLQDMLFPALLLEPHLAIEQARSRDRKAAEMFRDEKFVWNTINVYTHGMRAIYNKEQKLGMLRTIEAIRHWSAENKGTLPESLSALSLPAPIDLLSGGAFEYQRAADGKSAMLRGKLIQLDDDKVKNGYSYRLELP